MLLIMMEWKLKSLKETITTGAICSVYYCSTSTHDGFMGKPKSLWGNKM
jgi:hypothetical protein